MSLQLHLHPPIMTRGQGTQEEPDEFPYLNVEFLYLIKRAATPSFHSNLPRNKEREEHILRLLLLKTTTCPSRTLLDPTCRYYFAYYFSSEAVQHSCGGEHGTSVCSCDFQRCRSYPFLEQNTDRPKSFRNVPTEGVERSYVLFRAGPRMAVTMWK